jgi:hypothetical protein
MDLLADESEVTATRVLARGLLLLMAAGDPRAVTPLASPRLDVAPTHPDKKRQ